MTTASVSQKKERALKTCSEDIQLESVMLAVDLRAEL